MKNDFLLNKEIKVEFDLKKLDLINYGKISVQQTNVNSVIQIVSL